MPSKEAILNFVAAVVVPVVSGAIATWLASTQVLSIFNITADAAAAEITKAIVFVLVTYVAHLGVHAHLTGRYAQAAKAEEAKTTTARKKLP